MSTERSTGQPANAAVATLRRLLKDIPARDGMQCSFGTAEGARLALSLLDFEPAPQVGAPIHFRVACVNIGTEVLPAAHLALCWTTAGGDRSTELARQPALEIAPLGPGRSAKLTATVRAPINSALEVRIILQVQTPQGLP